MSANGENRSSYPSPGSSRPPANPVASAERGSQSIVGEEGRQDAITARRVSIDHLVRVANDVKHPTRFAGFTICVLTAYFSSQGCLESLHKQGGQGSGRSQSRPSMPARAAWLAKIQDPRSEGGSRQRLKAKLQAQADSGSRRPVNNAPSRDVPSLCPPLANHRIKGPRDNNPDITGYQPPRAS